MGFYISVHSYIEVNGNGVYKNCLEADKVLFSLFRITQESFANATAFY